MSSSMRYFQNPLINVQETADKRVENPHLKNSKTWQTYIDDTFFTCRTKYKCKATQKYCDGGLYTGSLGLIYTAFHLLKKNENSFIKNQEDIKKYVHDCFRANQVYFEGFNSDPVGAEVGLLVDRGGLYLSGCLAGRLLGDEELVHRCAKEYASKANLCVNVEFLRNGSDEIFVGRAGYLL